MCVFFTGLTLIIINELINKPLQITTYKYLPRDLDTYLREEPYASVTFADMFSDDFVPGTSYTSTMSNVGVVSKATSNGFTLPQVISNGATASPTLVNSSMGLNSPLLAQSSTIA